jgi:predicted house-cleaning noncanonical NTP pyrophosphatase (MazG superfamily)
MKKFKLEKLVRDKLLAVYYDLGEKPKYRILNHDEHIAKLAKKVAEEANELVSLSGQGVSEEVADIEQALTDLKVLSGITKEVLKIKQTKRREKGGFKKGVYIETLEVKETDPWCDYYKKDPKRFPEI